MPEHCPSFVTVASGQEVHCTKPVGHVPDPDVHWGRLQVTLPGGHEQTGFLVWSSWPFRWEDHNLPLSS